MTDAKTKAAARRKLRKIRAEREVARPRMADAAIEASDAGLAVAEIARELGVTRRSVYLVIDWRKESAA